MYKPYFLPWMGYFSKLLYAQVFVVQDNVLASNRVWINRTRIIRPDGNPHYLTLPIGKKGDTVISAIDLVPSVRDESARRMTLSIEHSYSHGRHFSAWRALRQQFITIMAAYTRLLEIDLALVRTVLQFLELPVPEIRLASTLPSGFDPVGTLVSHCRETNCDAIILGGGNDDWTSEDSRHLRRAGVTPLSQDFFGQHPKYYQTRRERLGFCPGLSILDCILNEGPARTVSLLRAVPCCPVQEDQS